MDGGDDGDDDDGDSSRDDANNEDEDEEDEEDEEEEEHLALADSTTVIPADGPAFPPEGTEPVIPPPSTDITIGARISVRPQISISLPPEADIERLLTMTTPSPSPPISLSPPFVGERLARCTAPPAHLPPLLPSLYIPPPVDRRDDIPESEQPPRKRLHLSTLGSRYEIGESSTARPTRGRGIYYRFVSTVDVEERGQGIRDVGYGIRDTWVDPAEAVPEIAPTTVGEDDSPGDSMDGGGGTIIEESSACAPDTTTGCSVLHSEQQHQVHETRFQMQHAELAALRETDRRRQDQMVEALRVIRDMRREMSDMQTELLALREPQRRARQPGPEARIPDHQEASGDADRAEGVVGLTRWIEKMESVFNISGCAIENQVKFATCTLLGAALTWWNGQIRTLGPEAYAMTWEVLKKKMTDKYCPQGEIKKLEIELWNLKVKGNDVPAYTERFQELTLICTKFVANETEKVDKYISGLPDNIYGNVKSARPERH
ncbi:putative reverse transcriptase domain-containing protein [Tanacetum coccineum]